MIRAAVIQGTLLAVATDAVHAQDRLHSVSGYAARRFPRRRGAEARCGGARAVPAAILAGGAGRDRRALG